MLTYDDFISQKKEDMGRMCLSCSIFVDRFSLARHFEFVRQCDEIQKMRDIGEIKDLAITLLRLNKGMRESVAAMVKQEIPIHQLPPS